MDKRYTKIGDFGSCILVNTQYGYDVCLQDGIDKAFAKGPGPVYRLGPSEKNCQAFMAEQCSVDWNENCEKYYQMHKNSNQRYFPNSNNSGDCQTSLLLGDTLLLNSAELRFFQFDPEDTFTEPLDPTNYSSPTITRFYGRRQIVDMPFTARFDANTIDCDDIMTRILAHPAPFMKFLHIVYTRVLDNINGPECDYVDQWDIRGTKTWSILCTMFENTAINPEYYHV